MGYVPPQIACPWYDIALFWGVRNDIGERPFDILGGARIFDSARFFIFAFREAGLFFYMPVWARFFFLYL